MCEVWDSQPIRQYGKAEQPRVVASKRERMREDEGGKRKQGQAFEQSKRTYASLTFLNRPPPSSARSSIPNSIFPLAPSLSPRFGLFLQAFGFFSLEPHVHTGPHPRTTAPPYREERVCFSSLVSYIHHSFACVCGVSACFACLGSCCNLATLDHLHAWKRSRNTKSALIQVCPSTAAARTSHLSQEKGISPTSISFHPDPAHSIYPAYIRQRRSSVSL